MSNDSSFLKNTLDLIENDPEIKSYIYQQILDFNAFVTPETLVMVIARDPHGLYEKNEQSASSDQDEQYLDEYESDTEDDDEAITDEMRASKYRIAIVLKEEDHSIECEAFHNDIFEAIRMAKELLIKKLIEIQEEVESPQDRINAIQQASENKSIH
jgi:hypothetical protein